MTWQIGVNQKGATMIERLSAACWWASERFHRASLRLDALEAAWKRKL